MKRFMDGNLRWINELQEIPMKEHSFFITNIDGPKGVKTAPDQPVHHAAKAGSVKTGTGAYNLA
jgi:hypothetical protein